jgi:hypothetical protein
MIPAELHTPVLIGLGVLTIIYLAVISHFFRHLKQFHEPVWIELGRPSLFLNNSLHNNWLVLKFLLLRRYSRLPDQRAQMLGNVVLGLLLICSLGFFVLFTSPTR